MIRLELNLRTQGMLIAGSFLAFECMFMGSMAYMLFQSEKQAEREEHAREIVERTSHLVERVYDFGDRITKILYERTPEDVKETDDELREIRELFSWLKSAYFDDAENLETVTDIETNVDKGILFVQRLRGEIENLHGEERKRAAHRAQDKAGPMMAVLAPKLTGLIASQKGAIRRLPEKQKEQRYVLKILLASAFVLNIVFVVLTALIFSRNIVAKLNKLLDNTERLKAGIDLLPAIDSADEIGELDRVFHVMADELKDAARKERAVIDYASDVICSVDSKGRFSNVSPACERSWGYRSDELVGAPLLQVIALDDIDSTRASVQAIRESQLDSTFENRVTTSDGRQVHTLWSAHWSQLEKSMYCVAHDITDRKRAENLLRENEERIRTIIEKMPIGLLLLKPDGRIDFANPESYKIFQYEPDSLIGLHITNLFSGDHTSQTFQEYLNLKAAGRVVELTGIKSNRVEFPVEFALNEYDSSQGLRYLSVIVDVTERHEVQKMRQAFVSMVSHELRTPLNSVLGHLQMVEMGVFGELPPELVKGSQRSERNVERLIGLINDLLDLEKLESGTLAVLIEPVELGVLVESAVESVQEFAKQHSTSIKIDIVDCDVFADEGRIIQVLINLLSNAIKYSPAGSAVVLRTKHDQKYVEVSIIDSGRGVPIKYQEVIFERFQQVQESDGRRGAGTGLGLAICKTIIEQHSGRIGVESEEGRGSRFWFTLPLCVSDAPIPN